MTGEHGRGGRRSRQGGDLTGKQQHSFFQSGCQLCYSPAQDLAQGAALGTEELRQGGWPLSHSGRKTSNCSAPPPKGSLLVPGPRRARGKVRG